MRPRRHVPQTPPEPTVIRAFDYRGYSIAKMSDETFSVKYPKEVYPGEPYMPNLKSPEEARNWVDRILAQFEKLPVSARPRRPRRLAPAVAVDADANPNPTNGKEIQWPLEEPTRPTRPKRPHRPEKPMVAERPHGGYTPHPPERCPFRIQFEGESAFYINNITCVSKCGDPGCDTFCAFMEGQKARIARLSYKTPEPNCEYCKAKVSVKGDDEWTYECGTTFDKKTEKFTWACKKPTRPQRPTRPTRPQPKEEEAPAPASITINRRRR